MLLCIEYQNVYNKSIDEIHCEKGVFVILSGVRFVAEVIKEGTEIMVKWKNFGAQVLGGGKGEIASPKSFFYLGFNKQIVFNQIH